MKKRKSKPDDNKNIEKGYNLFIELLDKHPNIENSIWMSIIINFWLDSFLLSGGTYEVVSEELDRIKEVYKMKLSFESQKNPKAPKS